MITRTTQNRVSPKSFSALAEESVAASEELSSQAEILWAVV